VRIDPSSFRPPSRATFVAFEGINGCGKTTLMKALSACLRQRSVPVVETREPGGTPLGEELRRLLLEWPGEKKSARSELLLFAAGRAEHVDKVIRPALARGEWVLCDRFMHSSVAFQGYGRGIDLDLVSQANDFAVQGTLPDLVVLIDIDPLEAQRRIARRQGSDKDSFEAEDLAFHRRIRDGFLECARSSPVPFLVLNGSRSPDELRAEAAEALSLA